jgi:hypothetical protein
MLIIKLYRKPNKPEFFIFVRRTGDEILLNYPIEVPDRKRHARWLGLNEVYIDWIREFV